MIRSNQDVRSEPANGGLMPYGTADASLFSKKGTPDEQRA
jgi:hypothetical protein